MDYIKAGNQSVTIIMPVYNCERYIEAAIQSVILQTYPHWELIVIDDGSSDSTCSIVRKMEQKDSRIKLLRNPENMGTARTRNRGLDLSAGDYVAFLDSDDTWQPDKLLLQIQKMQRENGDISYTSYAIIDNEGNAIKKTYIVPETTTFDDLLKENVIGCSTVMLSGDMAKKYRFIQDFYHEDYCLWLDMLCDGCKAVGCTETLVNWRLIENSRSFNKKNSALKRWKIYREYLGLSYIKSMSLLCRYFIRGIRKYHGRGK